MDTIPLPFKDRFRLACDHVALEYRRRVADPTQGDLSVLTAASRWSTGGQDFRRMAIQLLDALER
jgi:hypothetical protein